MTENEKVKKWFKTELSMREEESLDAIECEDMMDICVKALEELQQYRAIGTVRGYERAIETSKENYNLYREYKGLLRGYEAIGTVEDFKTLKNAEEQGLLLRLPCKVGTTVFWVYDCRMIREVIVYGYRIEHGKLFMLDYSGFHFGTAGVDVFLTREEAEQALKQMGE